MQQYAIVFFPKIDIEEIQSFREKYDLQYRVIPPHITLVFPFSGISEEQIVKHLDRVTKDIKSFQIHLDVLGKSFDNYLFLLAKEGKGEINSLHKKLYSGILAPHILTDIPFIPHITLGKFNSSDNQLDQEHHDKAYAEAESLNLNIWCSFDSISLIQGDGATPAKTIQTFTFK